MKYYLICIIVCFNSIFSYCQTYHKDKLLIQFVGFDVYSKIGKDEKSKRLKNKIDSVFIKYGKCKIEKAFPYAPNTSKRSKKILVNFEREINLKKMEDSILNEFKGYNLSVDSLPKYRVFEECTEINPLPDDFNRLITIL